MYVKLVRMELNENVLALGGSWVSYPFSLNALVMVKIDEILVFYNK